MLSAGVKPVKFIREMRLPGATEYTVGQMIDTPDVFSEGELVDVTGTSKGKGFAGGISVNFARYLYGCGSKSHREPGSIREPG